MNTFHIEMHLYKQYANSVFLKTIVYFLKCWYKKTKLKNIYSMLKCIFEACV